MSRLDSFVLRLAEKKMEMERSRRILHGDPVDDETLPHTTSIYGSKDYWETRFEDGCTVGASKEKGETNNEWYAGYDELEPILQRFTARNHRVLILGCGTSTLGEELAVRGFSRVEAVDYSENAILRMRETQETRLATHARHPPVRPPPHPLKADYRIMDVTKMTYPDRSVDCVLDKATLDTMKQLDDDDDEDDMEFSAPGASDKAVKPDPRSHTQRMLRESCRVLKPGGHYVCITYGEPQTRLPLFDPNNEGLGEWENAAGGDENDGSPYLELKRNKATYYVYVFRKRTDASLVAEQVVSELVDDSVTAAERTFKSE